MLAIVEPGNVEAVLALARRWEIRATVVGRVTDTARFRIYDGLFDAVVCRVRTPRHRSVIRRCRSRPTRYRSPTSPSEHG